MRQPDLIIKEVCTEFDVRLDDVMSDKRDRDYVYARHMICLLLRERTLLTLKRIGYMLSRDHTTIIYSVKSASNLIETYDVYRAKYHNIKKRLEAKAA